MQGQSCKPAIDSENTALEVKLRQQLEAAAAKHQELLDQVQVVTQSWEEKHMTAVFEADRKVSALVVCLQPNFTGALWRWRRHGKQNLSDTIV